jgi:hypothetical protein
MVAIMPIVDVLLHMHFFENEGFVKMDFVVKVKVKVKFAQ